MQLHFFISVLDLIDCWLFPKRTQWKMDFNSDFFKEIFKLLLSWWILFNLKDYILLARLTSNNANVMDIKTGAHAAKKGFKIPFTPRELAKKDKI